MRLDKNWRGQGDGHSRRNPPQSTFSKKPGSPRTKWLIREERCCLVSSLAADSGVTAAANNSFLFQLMSRKISKRGAALCTQHSPYKGQSLPLPVTAQSITVGDILTWEQEEDFLCLHGTWTQKHLEPIVWFLSNWGRWGIVEGTNLIVAGMVRGNGP